MLNEPAPEPIHVQVHGVDVVSSLVMTTEVADLFRHWRVFGDDLLIDVTTMVPRPGIGWTYDAGTDTLVPPPPPMRTEPSPASGGAPGTGDTGGAATDGTASPSSE